MYIVAQWHKSGSLDTIYQFFDMMLHHPLQLSMHTEYFTIFAGISFPILYDWLLPQERKIICEMFINRDNLFKHINFSPNTETFFFTDCKLTLNMSIQHRRELVRDFVFLCYTKKDIADILPLIMIKISQKLMLLKHCDVFVKRLHYAVQGHGKIEEIICI